jgi:glutamate synthase domain-containing protein 2/glutamate synthase domain-containing protein 1/glutamate synthase domain-containing protein 3
VSARAPQRRADPPLYDSSFEHDACGVGFVADAGGRSAGRVLPLALAGLSALGHRGAFAADGESSDGAGVLLPLAPSIRSLLDPSGIAGDGSGVVVAFLPRGRATRIGGREAVEQALRIEGLELVAWRPVPVTPDALGTEARASRPAIEHALVRRPAGWSDAAFELALMCARRRAEGLARAGDLTGFSIASASATQVVYKGLVTGSRLAAFYPDLQVSLAVPYAVFHQRYATNTTPTWALAQPFSRLAHNGEIDTIRGNREAVRGRRSDGPLRAQRRRVARRLLDAGPLIDVTGSDSRSLDEAVELLVATGWSVAEALLALVPDAASLRRQPHPTLAAFRRRIAGFVAPWDGPAALVFADGRRVGALLDRNGLRPAAWAVTSDRLVALASEAGAVPLDPAEIERLERLGPGEMLLIDPPARAVYDDASAKSHVLRGVRVHDAPVPAFGDRFVAPAAETSPSDRLLAGLDAERLRLDVKTMATEGHEPLWSMGDDTPLAGRARMARPVVDHLRQAFAQVTNPPIDPERERAVMDLRVELGARPALLGGRPSRPTTLRLERPVVADLDGLLDQLRWLRAGTGNRAPKSTVVRLDATWDPTVGVSGLRLALEHLATEALTAACSGRTTVVVLSDRSAHTSEPARLPIPSVLAVGRVHAALTQTGLRGRVDVVADAADLLDVHTVAMALASGATAVHPRLLLELAAEHAGSRGFEDLTRERAVEQTLTALDAGLRKILARMGISAMASYIGGQLFETLELAPAVVQACFPAAAAWPGRLGFDDLAAVQLRRLDAAHAQAAALRPERLPDHGLARYRADGELHLYAPPIANAVQALATAEIGSTDGAVPIEQALATYRASLTRAGAVVRDGWTIRRPRGTDAVPIARVEPASAIARRFVVSAMSVGALSPEAHRALTLGIQSIGGAANTGEGGEDPAWYRPEAAGQRGERPDARIKQVASARFGVTAEYLARAEQLEIKIAQGSKPGEGGQLPGRKATAYIASLRRAQPGQSLISPPPHHDIYSIEDLAQLVADLRAIAPEARIGVKLVASRGVGTIASGVAKAGADYIHLSGHSGGTGASPLSSIKHVGAPWELGLAEVHQTLLRNHLRDRVVLRTDGGLQTGRDLLIAALLGAEEFAFGTAALVAIGCDMARQCHLDTCPTGIATQREDLRAKFAGTPEQAATFFLRLAEDLRLELAAVGVRSVGELVGESRRILRERAGSTIDLRAVAGAPAWGASAARRQDPGRMHRAVARAAASPMEVRLVAALQGQGSLAASGLRLTTAERSFGAGFAGALERDHLRGPIRLGLHGAAGQSFGAFAGRGISLTLDGVANDGVGKGLSGGTLVVRPDPAATSPAAQSYALAGNACLYGATSGRLHVLGRAGMRFAVRNSGAEAVVEGLGPHGCEYMTGGAVLVLGPVGPNFGAGMTGGLAFLYDPDGAGLPALHGTSVRAIRLTEAAQRPGGEGAVERFRSLLEAHRDTGSTLAARILATTASPEADTWLVEPWPAVQPAEPAADTTSPPIRPQPDRNTAVPRPVPTAREAVPTVANG